MSSSRVIIDAKATNGNKVADSQINWLAINQHQQQAQAQHAAVVGIDFAGGNLLKWANEYRVSLLRTSDIIDLVRMHHQAPFSLIELRSLFVTNGMTPQPLQELRLIFESRVRHWQLLLEIVEQIDHYNQFNRRGLAATPEGIQLMLYTKMASQVSDSLDPSRVPSIEDVRDAMTFLSSRAVGVLRETPTDSGKYHLTMHIQSSIQRITALGRRLGEMDSKAVSIVSPSSQTSP